MKRNTSEPTDESFESLLHSGLVQVPDDFDQRILHEISRERLAPAAPIRRSVNEKVRTLRARWQWLALVAGTVVGLGQFSAFVFGIWAATAAG